jgi:predicted nucleotidyltransferase
MPVRSLNSSVFKWPDLQTVQQSVVAWANEVGRSRPEISQIGYFGSYARGDWGVASDLDIVVILSRSEQKFGQRALDLDTTGFPVPVDIMVYTRDEWIKLIARGGRFSRVVEHEVRWVYDRRKHSAR